jgi:putative transposase
MPSAAIEREKQWGVRGSWTASNLITTTKPLKKNMLILKVICIESLVLFPNQGWCCDVAYLWTGELGHYLAVILDLYSQKVIDFVLSDSPDSELTKLVLSKVFVVNGRPLEVMFHSDQGCHYTSLSFRQLVWKCQIKQSMSRRGNYCGSPPIERFFRSLKTEIMPKKGYNGVNAASNFVGDYMYYNSVRPYSHN